MRNLPIFLSVIGLLVATIIWGSTFFIVKGTLSHINPVALVAYRFGIATLVFAGCGVLKREKLWVHFQQGVLLGFILWAEFILQTVGLKYTTASNSGFITGLVVLFVPVFEYLFLRKKPRWIQIIALGMTVTGLWFLTGGLVGMNDGDLLTLGTAIAAALYILTAHRFLKENKNIVLLNFQQFFTVTFLSLFIIWIFHLPISIGEPKVLLSIGYLGAFASAIAFGLLLFSQKNIKPLTASLILSMEPVFAALFAWTLGNEAFLLIRAIGGLFIILSIILCEIEK